MGTGKVYIVGAGPGAADLITVRGARAVSRADVVICDSLLPRSFLDDLGIQTAGKVIRYLAPGQTRRGQGELNSFMCAAAREGRTVVRLKNGDPLVFGRASEEVQYLTKERIPWEIVPGASVATAGPSAAALPLTYRGEGRSFAVVTARCAGGAVNESFPRADTLVVFMAVSVIEQIVARLLDDGWASDTPAALIERATLPWERRVRGTLSDMAHAARRKGIRSPAILVVGAACRRHGFQSRPVILYTGLDPTSFRTLGDIVHWPALQVVLERGGARAFSDAVGRLGRRTFDWVLFTSKLGVRSFFAALGERGLDARVLARARISAAGSGTEFELRQHGLVADAVAQQPGSEGILLALPERPGGVLLVQGTHAPRDLESRLRERRCAVTRLALHRIVPHAELGLPLPEHDVVYFTSPSGVRAYWEAYGEGAFRNDVWCIGEVTLRQLEEFGFQAKVVNPNVPAHENATVPAI